MSPPKTPKDHVIAVIKAALNLIPSVGGSIASLISDYVPTSTEHAIEETIKLLAGKLTSLEGRIDVEAVNKEDFSELFKSCYLVIVRSNRQEKLHAAASLMANLLLRSNDPNKSSYEELDHFVRCLDALSIGAISALGAAHHIVEASGASIPQRSFHFPQLHSLLPQFDPSLLMSLVSELRSLNLLRVQDGGVRMPDHGEVLLELTPIGQRFVERFIEGKM